MVEISSDVEMPEVQDSAAQPGATEGEAKKDPDLLTVEDVREQVKQLEKAVYGKDFRFTLRTLRCLANTRRKLNPNVLRRIIFGYYTHSSKERELLCGFLAEPMDTSADGATTSPPPKLRTGRSTTTPLIPEIDAYLHLLVLLHLLDTERKSDAVKCADHLMNKLKTHNRRSLDLIAARCYFYYSRAYEQDNKFDTIRPLLHAKLRTATLRNDYEGQAVLINCLLRNYLLYNLYEQADKLVSKSTYPENAASNNEMARYLYYLGRIRAVQLDYSNAQKHLMQALRKAPQHAAVGFKQTVQKLLVTVELLLGDIPERSIFHQAHLKKSLAPYFQLTQAVRLGNLNMFVKTLETYHEQFQQDRTYILIQRLRHNVIKTGLRAISASYSRISLADVATKLALEAKEDAEFIVAKAIRDSVIEAAIDHEGGFMASKERTDVYCTQEPQLAFHQRITFCLNIHNQSVKAMRYPPKSYNKDLESAEERREREQQDLELAKEMAEDDDDFV
uniref:Probable 26S proteasome non-ATPase regulatory subunit 3 n=1 Tax=Isotomurus palustris TaxID=36144 RepID=A0A481SY77_9HEXA|nr:26S proteasome regulatory subunit S3 [Isotomurus palustris]